MTSSETGSTSGVARAISQLTDETSELVRREVVAARTELLDRLAANVPAAGMLCAAGLLGTLCVASSHRWLVQVLEKRLSPLTAAVVATFGYGTAAGVAGVIGVRWLRRAPTPVPVDTAREVRHQVDDVTAAVQRGGGDRPG